MLHFTTWETGSKRVVLDWQIEISQSLRRHYYDCLHFYIACGNNNEQ